MTDSELATYCTYMRAHIRASDARSADSLSDAQLHDAFHTLLAPEVGFHEWLERTGRAGGPPAAQPAGGASALRPALGQIERANTEGLAALRALQEQGFPVSVFGDQ
jgi:hypothetical protein